MQDSMCRCYSSDPITTKGMGKKVLFLRKQLSILGEIDPTMSVNSAWAFVEIASRHPLTGGLRGHHCSTRHRRLGTDSRNGPSVLSGGRKGSVKKEGTRLDRELHGPG